MSFDKSYLYVCIRYEGMFCRILNITTLCMPLLLVFCYYSTWFWLFQCGFAEVLFRFDDFWKSAYETRVLHCAILIQKCFSTTKWTVCIVVPVEMKLKVFWHANVGLTYFKRKILSSKNHPDPKSYFFIKPKLWARIGKHVQYQPNNELSSVRHFYKTCYRTRLEQNNYQW